MKEMDLDALLRKRDNVKVLADLQGEDPDEVLTAKEVVQMARGIMAAYKYPLRVVVRDNHLYLQGDFKEMMDRGYKPVLFRKVRTYHKRKADHCVEKGWRRFFNGDVVRVGMDGKVGAYRFHWKKGGGNRSNLELDRGDVAYLLSEEGRRKVVALHVEGIEEYWRGGGKLPAS